MINKIIKEYKNPKLLNYSYNFKKFKSNIPALVVVFSVLTTLKGLSLIIRLSSRGNFDANNHYKNEIWFSSRKNNIIYTHTLGYAFPAILVVMTNGERCWV
jgi:hypothetical protein